MRRLLFWASLTAVIALIAAASAMTSTRTVAAGCLRPFLEARAALANAVAASLTSAQRIQLANSKRVEQNLRTQLAASRGVLAENAELRAYLRLPPSPNWRVVVAPVLTRDPVTWNRRFRIGKGSADGLCPGAAVLNGKQLIGRIAELTPHTALVVTIADTSCRLSVIAGATKAVGILRGRINQPWQQPPACMATYLPLNAGLEKGDAVTTSGLGGSMPAGIPVGTLIPWEESGQVVRIAEKAYAEVLLRPGADFGISRFAGVVVPAGGAATPENPFAEAEEE